MSTRSIEDCQDLAELWLDGAVLQNNTSDMYGGAVFLGGTLGGLNEKSKLEI